MGRIEPVAAVPTRLAAIPSVNQEEREWTVVKPKRIRKKKRPHHR
jgi:hypothetical protein